MEEKQFSEGYFDSGESAVGQYSSYEKDRFAPAFKAMVTKMMQKLKSRKALEIGCAKGYLVEELRNRGVEAFGVDISSYAISTGPESVRPFLHVVDLNIQTLPFADTAFDTVICMGTLEYVERQDEAIADITRVMRGGGLFLMTTLSATPDGDNLRLYTRSREQWNSIFEKLGFRADARLAEEIFSAYVMKIVEFDFVKSMSGPSRRTAKGLIGTCLYYLGAKALVTNYLLKKQIKAGYTMLAFHKAD